MKTFYHFTNPKAWKKIQQDQKMETRRRMIQLGISDESINEKAHEGAIFGVLEENPESWWKEEYYEDTSVIEVVLSDRASINPNTDKSEITLLKIKAPEDTHVADWGVHLREEYNGVAETEEQTLIRTKAQYANSLTPIENYDGGHTLPEVVCFSDIPLENIEHVGTYDVESYVNDKRKNVGKGPSRFIW